MKKLKYSIIMILSLLLVSCGSEKKITADGIDMGKQEEWNVAIMGVEYNLYSNGYAEIKNILNSYAQITDKVSYNGKEYSVVALYTDNNTPMGAEYANSIFEQMESYEELEVLKLPDTIIEIPKYGLAYCDSKTIELPTNLKIISSYAFERCEYLEELIIPESIEQISTYHTFAGCNSLKSIELPKDCKYFLGMSEYTFAECKNLERIVIPAGFGKIGPYTFSGCTMLSEIILEEGITEIYSGSFRELDSLVEIVFPESVTTLSSSIFWDCPNLRDVWISDNVTDVPTSMFKQSRGGYDADVSNITIHVKAELVDYVQNLYPDATVVAK